MRRNVYPTDLLDALERRSASLTFEGRTPRAIRSAARRSLPKIAGSGPLSTPMKKVGLAPSRCIHAAEEISAARCLSHFSTTARHTNGAIEPPNPLHDFSTGRRHPHQGNQRKEAQRDVDQIAPRRRDGHVHRIDRLAQPPVSAPPVERELQCVEPCRKRLRRQRFLESPRLVQQAVDFL